LRQRIDYQLTNYRKHGHPANEAWITVDKERIFSASCCEYMNAASALWYQEQITVTTFGPEGKRAEDILTSREAHDACDVVSSFRTYLDLDPQIALTSTDPILRGLAMIDKRIGKRTLWAIELSNDEHSLVRTLHSLRMSCRNKISKETLPKS
jgi:hypothetical protein